MSILSIDRVRSYRGAEPVTFDLSEHVTMVYGQNGSGKSTISTFFYRPGHPDYAHCSLSPKLDMRTLVFSQEYVFDLFNRPSQPGIFSLSEENSSVREELGALEAQTSAIQERIEEINIERQNKASMADRVRESCAERIKGSVAEIKKYADLWDLMDGAKQGARLYQAIIDHPDILNTSTADLSLELKSLKLSQGNHLPIISELVMPSVSNEENTLLNQVLVPSGDSTLSAAISRLGNADWVAAGQEWLMSDVCPFCQSPVDAEHLKHEIAALFDRSWEDSITRLQALAHRIRIWLDATQRWAESLRTCPISDVDDPINHILKTLTEGWKENLRLTEHKLSAPADPVNLQDLSATTEAFYGAWNSLNGRINEHNRRAENYHAEHNELKYKLRSHIRQLSVDTIITHNAQLAELKAESEELSKRERRLDEEKETLNSKIRALNGQIINCIDTINKINDGLEALGIAGFRIVLHDAEQDAYRLDRGDGESREGVFRSLSEGEKTLIAFLYYLETCEGRSSRDEHDMREKLIVIDDPISSLSQNYIFEIASLIQQRVIQSGLAAKVIILTHSLFFFQEMLLSSKNFNKTTAVPKGWRLYRLTKNNWSAASLISGKALMNDYQAMWHVLKESRDEQVATVIIPNTMRQILEYYFAFSGKHASLTSALEGLAREKSEPRFKAFARYINRHSHADARNIKLLETASVAIYMEWFERIFEAVGDKEHYRFMMAEDTP